MAGAKQTSCILCLCAFEPAGMIEIPLPHHAFLPDASVQLCQECCAAVLETCVKRHEAAPASDAGELPGQAEDLDIPDSAGERE